MIVVTGAKGRLGSALVRYLQGQGLQVTGLSRQDVDLTHPQSVAELTRNLNPSLILHPAAMTSVDACELHPDKARADNQLATENLARAALGTGSRLVYFSTDYVFDGRKDSPYTEEDEPNPINVYGQTKLAAEQAVSSILNNYAIIRVSWLFGAPGDFCSFVAGQVERSIPPRLTIDHRGSPGYIPDLLPEIRVIMESTETGIFHLTNRGDCTRFQMGSRILELLDAEIEPIASTGSQIGFAARRPGQSVLSCEKYETRFYRKLRSWQEALNDYLAHPG